MWNWRRTLVALGGVLLGASAGVAAGLGAAGVAADGQPGQALPPILEATHLPPLLTARGEPVDLRYDVFCAPAGAEIAERPCDASGTVFVRTGDTGTFQSLPLREDLSAAEGRYHALVPSDIARSTSGFSYYATFRSEANGSERVLPAGGAEAPERSLPLGRSVDVHLGTHIFGATRKPDVVVASAPWGDGPGDVGIEQARNFTPIGGSSFDVDSSQTVSLLDEAHKRLLRWGPTGGTPTGLPLAIDGTLADLAVGNDGKLYVLESTDPARKPLLREFGPDGSALGSVESSERASQVRIGANGPILLEQPSNEWVQAGRDGALLPPSAQAKSGRSGRPLRAGREVVLLRRGNEIRVAVTSGGDVLRAWRVTSDTPIAEVQLAEPLGNDLVVVARVYSDVRDEFVVLVLGRKGIVRSFPLAPADWAETSPLARFRLVGSSLYQLGSTDQGVFVDRFDLAAR